MTRKSNSLKQYSIWKSLIFRRIFWGFKNIPYKFMLVLILLSLWLGEWYPISNFPMYSGFTYSSDFVYVTDGQDRPIPLQLEFGFRTGFLKKAYDSRLKQLSNQKNSNQKIDNDLRESLKQLLANNNINQNIINQTIKELSEKIYQEEIYVKAGEQLLQYIVNERNPQVIDSTNYQKLKLWEVIVSIKNKQTVQKQNLIAEINLP